MGVGEGRRFGVWGVAVWVGVTLTSSQFDREGITLKALGNFPDLYLLRILPTLDHEGRGGEGRGGATGTQ